MVDTYAYKAYLFSSEAVNRLLRHINVSSMLTPHGVHTRDRNEMEKKGPQFDFHALKPHGHEWFHC